MIRKTLFEGAALAAFFLGIWFAFSQVDFMKLLKADNAGDRTGHKLGEMFWKSVERSEDVVYNDSIVGPVQKIIDRIAEANGIEKDSIKLHVVHKDEVNAFAMPGSHMVVFTGLIAESKSESELAGVIGHELAHLEKNHVMKKLAKELGLSVILQMATGGQGSEMISQGVRMLSSSAYDRTLESEADRASVDYLAKAGIDPKPFADFLYRMSQDADLPQAAYWIATHPESQERGKAVLKYASEKKFTPRPILAQEEWKSLKELSH